MAMTGAEHTRAHREHRRRGVQQLTIEISDDA